MLVKVPGFYAFHILDMSDANNIVHYLGRKQLDCFEKVLVAFNIFDSKGVIRRKCLFFIVLGPRFMTLRKCCLIQPCKTAKIA